MSKAQKFSIEATRESDFPRWYKETVVKSEILDYHDINGCYVLRPNGFFIWSMIKQYFTEKIESMGVKEAYFPMLVSKAALEKEKEHLDDFAPEVAWITECGGKPLENPVAIRPTSETIMYPYYSKWIQSYRDLPLKLNQWCNVLRWETTQTMPFVRGREFLWQEGHTAHLTRKEADKEVFEVLDLYADVYRELLAVPVVKGTKSKKETFAGADFTTTVEVFIPSTGKGIQAATSHSLGTNFSNMFNVTVEDPSAPGSFMPVFQNSWGLSTRSIGVAILVHSDNRGVVLPPKVASVQVVIVPCGLSKNTSDEEKQNILAEAERIEKTLKSHGIRAQADLALNVTPGHKFNHWEVRGVPLRIEIGPKDMKNNQACFAWRMDKTKKSVSLVNIAESVKEELESIHETMYQNAKLLQDSCILKGSTMDDLNTALRSGKMCTMVWCGAVECEEKIKKITEERDKNNVVTATGAKSLCIPFTENKPTGACSVCTNEATCIGLFGRSY
ncbi:bifunctional glutamyl/prolyl-tRNA synthetase [Nematocida parisii]|uniref:Proline--tRNA ligase n=1 Tax=Nematocida parisii (strain ERTm3) TaxID=935791 RepID=I3EHD7_NEMP3|nr:prolyl tRNA synthetase [Nematocida parisii ERTm1]EIJ88634.1 prolyl tRNA synthetase [Nematocida parisii ERTm3]KAI5126674.1 bifunctional glutamyl/prolyl-tRNA synthetase [Nematocida parisii]EIJ94885.1 prolyl tRNA synthetase [Nematocida parisii ERTm1]KAI5130267.1 bifunctional glutamyl/prolyl-tRNA synthetase [Nematocida parisii]KAI5143469.1 bifunctional glutamyl/prolyl-tRNA synthetase [Nematocida parisii]|eukprot:XP_013058241.1 prolyl tRNA synthetase [Nematocida parisii ERTm1]